ncbi:hypothetical protein CSOJ01_01996 [Colletotrichum sojae]|uniref:Uncharacterized protein n=1 Tax=Colletotrichum sojae TaxID=2175907 RepID=A0A8H6JSR5_9PEZI|nr:hypothetical protein CSOJ01_01996 [Colletotrichum sojae]
MCPASAAVAVPEKQAERNRLPAFLLVLLVTVSSRLVFLLFFPLALAHKPSSVESNAALRCAEQEMPVEGSARSGRWARLWIGSEAVDWMTRPGCGTLRWSRYLAVVAVPCGGRGTGGLALDGQGAAL